MSEKVDDQQSPFFLKVQNGEVEYEFRCPPSSPLSEVYSVLAQMMAWCEELAKEHEKKESEKQDKEVEVIESNHIEV